ncbi:trigger factor [Porphyromonas gingivalis F0185]|nr:trigger factor [Porphyromonas gingivalis F0185]
MLAVEYASASYLRLSKNWATFGGHFYAVFQSQKDNNSKIIKKKMNVSIKNTDAVNAIATVAIEKADYANEVEKALRTYRQRANVPGFRKGMVPMGMIKKMYGKGVKAEEINRVVGRELYRYIAENKLNVLGEPMPNEELQKEYDFDTTDDFEFVFDLALSPVVDVVVDKSIRVPYYTIQPTEEMIDRQIESMRSSYGHSVEADEVTANDVVKGRLCELEDGQPKEGGICVEEAMLLPAYMKDEEEKNKFVGAAKNSVVVFNPSKAYNNNEYELSSLLKVDKSAIGEHTGDFSFEISSISRHEKAELNEEFFKQAFGEETDIKNEADLRVKVTEGVREQFTAESDYKFLIDLRRELEAQVGELQFPDALLKRWLKLSHTEWSDEELEKQYPAMIKDLTFHVIKEDLVKKNDIVVTPQEVRNFAIIVAKNQFAQYGMSAVPQDALERYANTMMEKEDARRNFFDRVTENKLAAALKEKLDIDAKTVSPDEFNKLMTEQPASAE